MVSGAKAINGDNTLTFKQKSSYNSDNVYRCPKCGRILCVGRVLIGNLTVNCSRSKCSAICKITTRGVFVVTDLQTQFPHI